jgi:hypothetical protein
MDTAPRKNSLVNLASLFVYAISIAGAYFVTYTYIGPRVEEIINKNDINKLSSKQVEKKNETTIDRGLRTARINDGVEEVPKDIVSEVTYRDIRLISTADRAFSEQELNSIKLSIDLMPQKLFDYRPWAIISTKFDKQNFLTEINPEGVAFTSGPYIFVGDVTFQKQDSYDTGTFRGLMRVMAHEFVHVAQFFNTSQSGTFVHTYLENSALTESWIQNTGWVKLNERWTLSQTELTTDYGRSTPVEDMADAIGALAIGDEYSISTSRINWILAWLETTKEELYQGTIPLSNTIKQRKTEVTDNGLLEKYADNTATMQDILNFQSITTISPKDFAKYYATEFEKRGWSGSISNTGVGEFIYQNKYKVNIEMDKNPLRVATIVVTVF